MKPIKTRTLLIFVSSAILGVGFFIFAFITTNQLKETAIYQSKTNLQIISRSMKSFLQKQQITSIKSYDLLLKQIAFENEDFRITLIDFDGIVIADSDAKNILSLENHLDRHEVLSATKEKPCFALRKSTVNQKEVLYFAKSITLEHNQKQHNYVLRLSMPLEISVYFTGNIKIKFLFSGIIIFSVIIILSILISNFVIKGISELKKASKEFSKNNFSYVPNVCSTKEINQLAKSLQEMAISIQNDRKRLKHLEQVRMDFVANVSHELKTPITSIKGFSETLLDGAINDADCAKNFISIINEQSSRMEQIIDDLLTLSRLEQENKIIDYVKIDLIFLLDSLIKKEYAENEKQIIFLFENKTNNEQILFPLNESLFLQAINNILQNAKKYCPPKSTVECLLEKNEMGDRQKIKIIIQDNGRGIPQEYKQRIFERFFRVDKGRSREEGETGLGLSIAKHIVNLHGGQISETGRKDGKSGCRFEIDLLCQIKNY